MHWFVRTVREGDTHLGHAAWRGGRPIVVPRCGGTAFVALNHAPIRDCYYDEQRCPACLAAGRNSTPLPLVAAVVG